MQPAEQARLYPTRSCRAQLAALVRSAAACRPAVPSHATSRASSALPPPAAVERSVLRLCDRQQLAARRYCRMQPAEQARLYPTRCCRAQLAALVRSAAACCPAVPPHATSRASSALPPPAAVERSVLRLCDRQQLAARGTVACNQPSKLGSTPPAAVERSLLRLCDRQQLAAQRYRRMQPAEQARLYPRIQRRGPSRTSSALHRRRVAGAALKGCRSHRRKWCHPVAGHDRLRRLPSGAHCRWTSRGE